MSTPGWVTDPFQGSVAAADATAAAKGRDRVRIVDAITAAQPSERSILVLSVAEVPDLVDWLSEWLTDDPNDPWLNAITAEAYLNWAKQARGDAPVKWVTAQEWQRFHARAAAAADIVRHAQNLTNDTALAGLPALGVAVINGGTTEDVHRALSAIDTAYPHDYTVLRRALTYFAPRWYGDITQVWDLALPQSAAAPDGAPTAAIVAAAVVEQCVWVPKAPGGQPGPRMAELLDEAAARTVEHPSWQWTPSGWVAVNELVLANLVAGRAGIARQLYGKLTEQRRTQSPWELLSGVNRSKHFARLSGSG